MTTSALLTVKDAMLRSAAWLQERGCESARLDAEVLLGHVLGMRRLDLYLDYARPLDEAERDAYREALRRRGGGEPVAYITGTREFFALPFRVSPAVLVPRPETELLVERALALISEMPGETVRIADIGTGSCAIAVAIAHEEPRARVLATDVSPEALEVARDNAEANGVSDGIRFEQADLLSNGGELFDLIVSNPPYVSERDRPTLSRDVRDYEPEGALFSGEDGLDCIRRIVAMAPARLRPGGWLAMEIGYDQADAVRELLRADGRYDETEIERDYQGIERIVSARCRDANQAGEVKT